MISLIRWLVRLFLPVPDPHDYISQDALAHIYRRERSL
jgi:hypothetical protein